MFFYYHNGKCDALFLGEMLAHPGIRSADDERYQVIGPLLAAPIEHVRALTRMYVEIR